MTLDQLQAGIVIAIDKPVRWTSFQAVNKVKGCIRRLFDIKKFKIGHAGTLDPLASGLLLVCVGKATKSIDLLQQGTKVYSGTMVIGATTPCYDLERPIDHYYPFEHITPDAIEKARQQLEGTIMQVPPMYSAVHVEGMRAYQYARLDDPTVTIQPKAVEVEYFHLDAFRQGDGSPLPAIDNSVAPEATQLYANPQGMVPAGLPQVDFEVRCGKGTYIRSMARDFGMALGSGAFLSALRREQVGDYTLEQAITLEQVEEYLRS